MLQAEPTPLQWPPLCMLLSLQKYLMEGYLAYVLMLLTNLVVPKTRALV